MYDSSNDEHLGSCRFLGRVIRVRLEIAVWALVLHLKVMLCDYCCMCSKQSRKVVEMLRNK